MAFNIKDKVSSESIARTKATQAQNSNEFENGMNDFDDLFNSFQSEMKPEVSSSYSSSGNGVSVNSSNNDWMISSTANVQTGNNTNNQAPVSNDFDFYGLFKRIGKSTWDFFLWMADVSPQIIRNKSVRRRFFSRMIVGYFAITVLSLLMALFKYNTIGMMVYSFVFGFVSLIVWSADNLFTGSESGDVSQTTVSEPTNMFSDIPFESDDLEYSDDSEDDYSLDSDFESDDEFEYSYDDNYEYGSSGLSWENIDDFSSDVGVSFEPTPVIEGDTEKVLNMFDNIDSMLVNRKLLFDAYLGALDGNSSRVDSVNIIENGSHMWNTYSALVLDAQIAAGFKEIDAFEILNIEERLLTVRIEATRESATVDRVNRFNDELTRLVSYNDGEYDENVYSSSDLVGNRVFITIFKGEQPTVFLKTLLEASRSFFEDTNNKMPVAFGYDENGKVVTSDMYDLESMIVSGRSRSGKSVESVSIISQMVQFTSPKDLHIYVGDLKSGTSDWSQIVTPHLKRFERTPQGIINMMNDIIKIGEQRNELLGRCGVLNIKDFKKNYPEESLPFIYVIIDEMVALSTASTKEQLAEFQSLSRRVSTQFPNVGIRAILIPHRIVEPFIDKTSAENASAILMVREETPKILDQFRLAKKDFRYRLTKPGEIVMKRVIDTKPKYFRAPLLMSSDITLKRLLAFQGELWSKLCPEEVETSYQYRKENKDKSDVVLKHLGIDVSNNELDDEWVMDLMK